MRDRTRRRGHESFRDAHFRLADRGVRSERQIVVREIIDIVTEVRSDEIDRISEPQLLEPGIISEAAFLLVVAAARPGAPRQETARHTGQVSWLSGRCFSAPSKPVWPWWRLDNLVAISVAGVAAVSNRVP